MSYENHIKPLLPVVASVEAHIALKLSYSTLFAIKIVDEKSTMASVVITFTNVVCCAASGSYTSKTISVRSTPSACSNLKMAKTVLGLLLSFIVSLSAATPV